VDAGLKERLANLAGETASAGNGRIRWLADVKY
jgi:hypothetical protein